MWPNMSVAAARWEYLKKLRFLCWYDNLSLVLAKLPWAASLVKFLLLRHRSVIVLACLRSRRRKRRRRRKGGKERSRRATAAAANANPSGDVRAAALKDRTKRRRSTKKRNCTSAAETETKPDACLQSHAHCGKQKQTRFYSLLFLTNYIKP